MNGIVYDDDNRISAISAEKRWGAEDKIIICVEEYA
jgi:Holliday junction resolvase RusA-like endonuclease